MLLTAYCSGFHVDDSEVTLNVCLGKQFSGGELFFRGVRCEKHVNTESQPEVIICPLYELSNCVCGIPILCWEVMFPLFFMISSILSYFVSFTTTT